jgi:putative phage-type endonuclease
MEIFIVDTIVSNVMRDKSSVAEMVKRMIKFYHKSFININERTILDRIELINLYRERVSVISALPVIEQRSQEWFDVRKNMITASDFAQALGKGKFGTAKDFYKNKCGYETNKIDMNCPPLQWGVRYEEVANLFYKQKMGVCVTEFGILKHPTIQFIGASPDGVSDLGVMLEIKCPYRRKKSETIPEQYYYQIQGQLEVCNLDECDYLECYIKEYTSRDEMISDDLCFYKGVVYESITGVFEYGPLNDTVYEKHDPFEKVYYYGIRDYFLRRVYRDKAFFSEILIQLEAVWKNVEDYREDKCKYDKATKTIQRKAKDVVVTRLFRDVDVDDDI